jgi:methyl-accepting chemotaxis protein
MKIKVATRVIGGFSVLTLLLIILGVVTLLGNSSIKKGTETLQQVSLPALAYTNLLSENISGQQIQFILGYYSDSSAKIPPIEQTLTSENKKFKAEFSQLTNLISEQQQLSQPLNQLKSAYLAYEIVADKMLSESGIKNAR